MTATAAFPATVLDAGLDAISRGFALFPVNGATKRPATPHGFRDATLDPDTARAWWGPRGRYRSCGIGVATGAEVGLWVLDIDAGHDGFRGIEDVERRLGFRLPDTATVASPAGGLHLHWRHPGATVRIRNSTAVLASGLDVRGDSACITIPPTRRPDGRCYSWLRSWDELVAAPPDLLELVRERPRPVPMRPPASSFGGTSRYGQVVLDRECAALAAAGPGTRNDTAARCAFRVGRLVGGGELDLATAEHALVAAALATGDDERKTRSTVARCLRAGMDSPRSAPRTR